MFVITHALAPVAIGAAANVARLAGGTRERLFSGVQLLLIGAAGASPDVLSPHLSLTARLTSPTHTIWYLLAVYPVFLLLALWFGKNRRLLLAHAMWLAVLLHLASDALAGGVAWLYPLDDRILGGRFIPYPFWWLLSDAISVGLVILFHQKTGALEIRRDAARRQEQAVPTLAARR